MMAAPRARLASAYYKNGVYRGVFDTNYNLSQLVETASALGRSQYGGDYTANAAYNEFRIYSSALTDAQVAASCAAGPDALQATLALRGGITVDEPLTLAGNGAAGRSGVLTNLQDDNTLGGAITPADSFRIGSESGRIAVTSNIDLGEQFTLTCDGPGQVQVTGQILGTAPASYALAVQDDNPLVYYRFEETSGSVATDSSGHGYNGTYVGPPGTGECSATSELGVAPRFLNGVHRYLRHGSRVGFARPSHRRDMVEPRQRQLRLDLPHQRLEIRCQRRFVALGVPDRRPPARLERRGS